MTGRIETKLRVKITKIMIFDAKLSFALLASLCSAIFNEIIVDNYLIILPARVNPRFFNAKRIFALLPSFFRSFFYQNSNVSFFKDHQTDFLCFNLRRAVFGVARHANRFYGNNDGRCWTRRCNSGRRRSRQIQKVQTDDSHLLRPHSRVHGLVHDACFSGEYHLGLCFHQRARLFYDWILADRL
jgi:hypothetical protein